jgi:hypothetical protein
MTPYPSTDATSTGGDLEVSIKVLDGSAGKEALHHQQNAVDKECRGDAIDHILNDVNPRKKREKYVETTVMYSYSVVVSLLLCIKNTFLHPL